jgi:hypothetical protein
MAGPTKQKVTFRAMPAAGRAPGSDENLAFFHVLQAIHNRAARAAAGNEDRYFNVAGRPVRLRFTSGILASLLTPALSHNEIPLANEPELTVLIWDDVSTGTELPVALRAYLNSLGEWWEHLGPRGEVRQRSDDRIYAAFHLGPNILSMLDLQKGLGLYWVRDAQALPYYEVGSPLRTVLHWWADHGAYQFVHAGAVGTRDGGVLLAGRGGTGKSTTALACLQAGMLYASDDYCVVRADSEPRVHSVYGTAKLRGEVDLNRFPGLAPLVMNKTRLENDKALLFLHQHFPERVCRELPLKAILLPRVTDGKPARLRPARRAEALLALAPSTLFQLPGAGADALRRMAELVLAVPAYQLEVGSDLAAIPHVIQELLSYG